jgi:hypothetical protein
VRSTRGMPASWMDMAMAVSTSPFQASLSFMDAKNAACNPGQSSGSSLLAMRCCCHYKKYANVRPSILVTRWSLSTINDLVVTKNYWSIVECH